MRELNQVPDWERFTFAIAGLMFCGLIFLCVEQIFKGENMFKNFWNEIKTDYVNLVMFILMVLYAVKIFVEEI